jgi:hypothetical protein
MSGATLYLLSAEQCSKPDDYQCNSNGECIAGTQVCDNVPDCEDGDDEDSNKCQNGTFFFIIYEG